MSRRALSHACTHARTRARAHVHAHIRTRTHQPAPTRTRRHARTHAPNHPRMHVCTHAHTLTRAHTHTQGSPILDIKPYIPFADSAPPDQAVVPPWMNPDRQVPSTPPSPSPPPPSRPVAALSARGDGPGRPSTPAPRANKGTSWSTGIRTIANGSTRNWSTRGRRSGNSKPKGSRSTCKTRPRPLPSPRQLRSPGARSPGAQMPELSVEWGRWRSKSGAFIWFYTRAFSRTGAGAVGGVGRGVGVAAGGAGGLLLLLPRPRTRTGSPPPRAPPPLAHTNARPHAFVYHGCHVHMHHGAHT
jgi:hypothetical protein